MLNRYLVDAKFNFNTKKVIHVVMGNEASDLDSMASSVAYAWFREKTGPGEDEIFIPLINIPQEDFRLRTEGVYLFSEAGLEVSNLLFIDELDIGETFKAGKLKIILMDHNRLSRNQEYLSGCVEEIVDHHKDEEVYPDSIKTLEPVGSCATLVTEKIKNHGDPAVIDGKIAALLAGTILLDTVNLGKDAGRTTSRDEAMVDFLVTGFGIDRNKVFERLQFEKFNTDPLSSYDILRKDYKAWTMNGKTAGFSSALISAEKWLKKDPAILDSLDAWYTHNSLDILFVMIAYTEPQFTRELILFSRDEALREGVFNHLRKNGGALEPLKTGVPRDGRAGFHAQGNAGWSRKKMQPVVQEYFDSQAT